MAFVSSLSDEENKELRRLLGLPINAKSFKYIKRDGDDFKEIIVKDFQIVEKLEPSGSYILEIILENEDHVKIHADYFSEMQKPSFINKDDGSQKKIEYEKIGEALPNSYVIVDLETTGRNHEIDDIIEIGAIRYKKGIETDRLSILVKTKKELSEEIVSLTGITKEMIDEFGVSSIDAAKKLKSFLGGSIIIGHNFNTFDKCFINDLYENSFNEALKNNFIDTLTLAKEKYPLFEHHRLKDLAEMYSIDYSKAHRAVEDCEINHYVYQCLAFNKPIEKVKSNSIVEEAETVSDELVNLDDKDLNIWEEELVKALKAKIVEKELPENSLSLKGNIGRKNNSITSLSVCIYEPDLIEDSKESSRNTIVLRIVNQTQNSVRIEPRNSAIFERVLTPEGAEVRKPSSSVPYMKIDSSSDGLIPFILACVEDALDNYESKESNFACCARYKECSDLGKCIHPNKLFSKACFYRTNLENNKNFYK